MSKRDHANISESTLVLISARTHLSAPDKWVKHKYYNSDGAACLIGSVNKASKQAPKPGLLRAACKQRLRAAILDLFPARRCTSSSAADKIMYFNDHQDTQHTDVLEVLDHAIELSKQADGMECQRMTRAEASVW